MGRAAAVVLSLCALAFPGVARAAEQTLVFRSAPIAVAPYGVAEDAMRVDSPTVDGYVTGMSADVVDASGNAVADTDVMLHHVVFAKVLAPDYTCSSFVGYDGTRSPIPAQRFYAEGEEHMTMRLPGGFGYPNRGSDVWGLVYMLMNHHAAASTVFVRYTVHYVTGEPLRPVEPVWLDVRNCRADPVFNVPGTGGTGSTYVQHADFTMPESGSIVAAGGHLHGGGLRLVLSSSRCGGLYTFLPRWGGVEPTPVMHEPGPTAMTQLSDADGLPVRTGERLRLTAVYDDARPHVRVMGIAILYFAPGAAPATCVHVDPAPPGGPPPERVTVQLLRQPSGRLYRNVAGTTVRDFAFAAQRVELRRGSRFTWRFAGAVPHDVTLASGPVGFASPAMRRGTFAYRFTRPGVYRLYCSLHPSLMTQVVTVR